jgi:Domain of unknown function DUF11
LIFRVESTQHRIFPQQDAEIAARRLRGFEKIDLRVTKKDLVDPVRYGGMIHYRLQVKNLHPKLHLTQIWRIDSAIGVKPKDWLPSGTVLLSARGNGWNCHIRTRDPHCSRTSVLRPGQQATLNLKLRAPKTGNLVLNKAGVDLDQDDPNPSNNMARERTSLKRH